MGLMELAAYRLNFMSQADLQGEEDELPGFMALGFLLRTRADAWKLFCERQHLPGFSQWSHLPGFEYLQHALTVAEKSSFEPEGFLHWTNRHRQGKPELTELPGGFSPEGIADALEELLQEHVAWWGG